MHLTFTDIKQECIRVGCVPPAAEAVCWGGVFCLSACWDTPHECGPGDPPGVGLETPQPDPSTSCLAVGLVTPRKPDPSTSPLGVGRETPPPARPLNLPPGCGPGDLQDMLGYHPPPVDRMTDTRKNITFTNFVCRW